MAIEVTPVPPEGQMIDAPRNPAGEPYDIMMIFNGDTAIAFADTYTELCGLLIDGYMEIDETDATALATARLLHAVRAQVRQQAMILLDSNPALATPDELAILQGSRDEPPVLTEWACPIPLILCDLFYAPYTDLPVPAAVPRDGGAEARRLALEADPTLDNDDLADVSNIVWIRCRDEHSFIHSMGTIGEIQLALHDGDEDDGSDTPEPLADDDPLRSALDGFLN